MEEDEEEEEEEEEEDDDDVDEKEEDDDEEGEGRCAVEDVLRGILCSRVPTAVSLVTG